MVLLFQIIALEILSHTVLLLINLVASLCTRVLAHPVLLALCRFAFCAFIVYMYYTCSLVFSGRLRIYVANEVVAH